MSKSYIERLAQELQWAIGNQQRAHLRGETHWFASCAQKVAAAARRLEQAQETTGAGRTCAAAQVLGLTGGYSASDVTDAYRRAAKTTHPDAGGTADQFRAVQAAYEALRR